MKSFNCQSCGATNFYQKSDKYLCSYCQAEILYPTPKKTTIQKKNSYYFLATLLAISLFAYLFTSKTVASNIEKLEPNTISPTINKQDSNFDFDKKIKYLQTSYIDPSKHINRKEVFSKWMTLKEYQRKFAIGYYQKIFPAYIELDNYGNRRVLEVQYEPKFYWLVKSGRLFKEFKKIHIQQTMNGKQLLSLHIYQKDRVKIFSGVWVSKEVFNRETKKLLTYGIYPPK